MMVKNNNKQKNKGLHLNVYGFTLDEVVKLKSTLENLFIPINWNWDKDKVGAIIKCSIHIHNHNHKKDIEYTFEKKV
jgi:hypothetical protein